MIILYTLPTCPYCIKVKSFLADSNIAYEDKSIVEEENLNDLVEKTGIKQVPFLIDTEKEVSMHESEDIIDYLKTNHTN